MTPHQKRYWFHRWQHLYIWPLYGLFVIKWHLYDDFKDVITGRIGEHQFPRPKGWDLVTFILGKLVFLTLAIGIPLFKFLPKLLRKRTETLSQELQSARKATEDANSRLSAVEAKLAGLIKMMLS